MSAHVWQQTSGTRGPCRGPKLRRCDWRDCSFPALPPARAPYVIADTPVFLIANHESAILCLLTVIYYSRLVWRRDNFYMRQFDHGAWCIYLSGCLISEPLPRCRSLSLVLTPPSRSLPASPARMVPGRGPGAPCASTR